MNAFIKRFVSSQTNLRNKNDVTCSCKNFEFWDILYRHILRVFIHNDCFRIPYVYLRPCWCLRTLQKANKNSEKVLGGNNLIDLEHDVF